MTINDPDNDGDVDTSAGPDTDNDTPGQFGFLPRPLYSVGEHTHRMKPVGSGPTHRQPKGPGTHRDAAPDIGKSIGGKRKKG